MFAMIGHHYNGMNYNVMILPGTIIGKCHYSPQGRIAIDTVLYLAYLYDILWSIMGYIYMGSMSLPGAPPGLCVPPQYRGGA